MGDSDSPRPTSSTMIPTHRDFVYKSDSTHFVHVYKLDLRVPNIRPSKVVRDFKKRIKQSSDFKARKRNFSSSSTLWIGIKHLEFEEGDLRFMNTFQFPVMAEDQEYEFAAHLDIRGRRYRGYGRTCETQLPISVRWTDCDFVACISVAGKFFYAYGNLHEAPYYPPDEPLSPSVRPHLIPESIRHSVLSAVEEASGFPSRVQALLYAPARPRPDYTVRRNLPSLRTEIRHQPHGRVPSGLVSRANRLPLPNIFNSPSDPHSRSRRLSDTVSARSQDQPSDTRRGGASTSLLLDTILPGDRPSTASRGGASTSHLFDTILPRDHPSTASRGGASTSRLSDTIQARDGQSTSSRSHDQIAESPWWWGPVYAVQMGDQVIGIAFPVPRRSTPTEPPALEEPEADRAVEANTANDEGVGGARVADAAREEDVGDAVVADENESLITRIRKSVRDVVSMVRDKNPFKRRRME